MALLEKVRVRVLVLVCGTMMTEKNFLAIESPFDYHKEKIRVKRYFDAHTSARGCFRAPSPKAKWLER